VIAAGVIGVAVFGAGWLAGVVGTLGTTLNIAALRTIGQIGRFLLPTDGLWHAAISYLQPTSLIAQHLTDGAQRDPFYAQGAPSWPYLLWGRLLVHPRPDRRDRELRTSSAMNSRTGSGRQNSPKASAIETKQDLRQHAGCGIDVDWQAARAEGCAKIAAARKQFLDLGIARLTQIAQPTGSATSLVRAQATN
jgi:hypothetical protein